MELINNFDKWTEFVKNHKYEEWAPIHTEFINSQFEKAWEFHERLIKNGEGDKLIKLFNITNPEIIKKILKK